MGEKIMISSNDILNQARAWLGLNEKDGSYKQIIDIYNAYLPLARNYRVKYTDNWCAVFISALAIKCKATNFIPLECGAEEMIKLLKKKGMWQEDASYRGKVGDLIFYDWDGKDSWSDHVGIIEEIIGDNMTVIEGNKNNAVERRVIKIGNKVIRGYGIINYASSVATQNPTTVTDNNNLNYKVQVNTASGVNCRLEPNASSSKVTTFSNKTILTITKEANGWGYANNKGWVLLKYCIKVNLDDSSWKGNSKYYLENSAVGKWQEAMNQGFDTNELTVDNKFGKTSQDFAKNHVLWKGQSHNCITAIKWLQNRLRYFGFSKLDVTGKWSDYLDTCIKVFQKNRNLVQDAKVGLETTYYLLEGTAK